MRANVELDGYSIVCDFDCQQLPTEKTIINTINAYSWVVSDSDSLFRSALTDSDILLPDGISVVYAARILKGVKVRKVAGIDLHKQLLELLDKEEGRCFYLGSSDSVLKSIKGKVAEEYPNVEVGFFSPPFKLSFSEEDNEQMCSIINDFRPDVLFVGMTAPKQEKWIHNNKINIQSNVICGIGAVFDFYSGNKNRPPMWMVNLGMEWLGRLLSEPTRLWKRYTVYNVLFIKKILKLRLKSQS